jgi:ferredoxin
MSKIKFYFFSGTGNTKAVVKWFSEYASKKNVEVAEIDIAKLKKRKVDTIDAKDVIGFCSPTHGFNFPPIMMYFIFRFPRGHGNRVFIMNTRGGLKMGKFFLPGLSGLALWIGSLVLISKGYKIVGLQSVDLPSNWISLHPGMKQKVVNSIFEKRKKEVYQFTEKLISGKKSYRAYRDIVQDIIITPISIGYYMVGRFVFAKSFIASRKCIHCNICVDQCPVNAIKIVDKRCFWTHKCESCMHCMNICPTRAIETAHGFVIGSAFLFYTVFLTWMYNYTALSEFLEFQLNSVYHQIFQSILHASLFIFLFISFYTVMHFLMRFRVFERFFVLTSLSTYKFWRRYKFNRNFSETKRS